MATIWDYFSSDFPRFLKAGWDNKINGDEISVPVRVYFCSEAGVRFIGIYISASSFSVELCRFLMHECPAFLKQAEASARVSFTLADAPTELTYLPFSGRIFFYVEATLSSDDRTVIEGCGSEHGLRAIIRDKGWAAERSRLEKPAAFICHDSRDKDEIARPIAKLLAHNLCPVWFDEYSLSVGDSLRESIEKGLKEAKKCIVILTPHFLANKGWTKTEFNSVFTKELIEERKVFLPVWAGIKKEDVYEYCPSLADRVGAQWERGVETVVRELLRGIDIHGVNVS